MVYAAEYSRRKGTAGFQALRQLSSCAKGAAVMKSKECSLRLRERRETERGEKKEAARASTAASGELAALLSPLLQLCRRRAWPSHHDRRSGGGRTKGRGEENILCPDCTLTVLFNPRFHPFSLSSTASPFYLYLTSDPPRFPVFLSSLPSPINTIPAR